MHTIYRRIDDAFLDPLEFRSDSMLGIPGLMRAYRAGNVAIANAVGTGVADDKAIYPYVPEMIRFYLGEKPILQNVATYHMTDPDQLAWALDNLDRLVVKPTSESGGSGVFIGPAASDAEIAAQTARLRSAPERWIAQDLVRLSTVPDGAAGRHARAPARRPAAVRGLRRRRLGDPRRAHAGRPPGRRDDRQLLPRRRLEGHMGARRPRSGIGPGGSAAAQPTAATGTSHRRLGGAGAPAAAARAGRRGSALMLARIAHELFWLGRSVARADHTARLLQGVLDTAVEGQQADPSAMTLSWDSLLAMTGTAQLVARRPATADATIGLLVADRSHPASIVASIDAAQAHARAVRDVMSLDMWETINTFHMRISQQDITPELRREPSAAVRPRS